MPSSPVSSPLGSSDSESDDGLEIVPPGRLGETESQYSARVRQYWSAEAYLRSLPRYRREAYWRLGRFPRRNSFVPGVTSCWLRRNFA